MKLRHLRLENFKGIRELELDFRLAPGGAPRPLTCLLGDNGSGKTTVLQAIAYSLGIVTKKVRRVDQFDWPGFDRHRLGTHGPTRVELSIEIPGSVIRTWSAVSATGALPHLALPDPTRDHVVTFEHSGRSTELRGPQDLVGWLSYLWGSPLGNGSAPDQIARLFDRYNNLVSTGALSTAEGALTWCSGKDLLGALVPWLKERGAGSARSFRNRVRDWVRSHPSQTLQALPEWASFRALLNA